MKQTLQRLYQQHRQAFYSCALAVTRDPSKAEDAVHDAFAKLLTRQDPPSGSPAAYAFASVRNAAIDQLRRQSPAVALTPASIYQEASAELTPDRYAEDAERDRLLQDAVDALPEPQRLAIIMHIHAGLTFNEIAQAVGEPQATIASRYRRAIEKIAQSHASLTP